MKTSIIILTLFATFTYAYKEVSKAKPQMQIQTYSTARSLITYDEAKGKILVRSDAGPFCYEDLNAAYLKYLSSMRRGC